MRCPFHKNLLAVCIGGAFLTSCAYLPFAQQGQLGHQAAITLTEAKQDYQNGNYQDAYEQLIVLAHKGEANAQYALGFLYHSGKVGIKDSQKARFWFERAAKQGLQTAQQALALYDQQGASPAVPLAATHAAKLPQTPNLVESLNDRLYLQAQNQFRAKAYPAAFEKLHVLAQAGDARAQYALAYFYQTGIVVEKDTELAYGWLQKSAQQGNSKALEALTFYASKQKKPQPNSPLAQRLLAEVDQQNKPRYAIVDLRTAQQVASPARTVPVQAAPSQVLTASNHSDKPQWLMSQHPKHYTVQLTAGFNQDAIKRYIKRHKLNNQGSDYHFRFNGKDWYAVIIGAYPTLSAAKAAVGNLSQDLKSNKPWIRQIAKVQAQAGSDLG